MRYCDIDSGFVNLAMSWSSEIGRYRA